jgi:hypothetical protein
MSRRRHARGQCSQVLEDYLSWIWNSDTALRIRSVQMLIDRRPRRRLVPPQVFQSSRRSVMQLGAATSEANRVDSFTR